MVSTLHVQSIFLTYFSMYNTVPTASVYNLPSKDHLSWRADKGDRVSVLHQQGAIPASGSFPMSQLFISGGQIVGASTSTSVPPMNIQGWFPLGLTGLISLQSKGFSRVLSSTATWTHQFFSAQPPLRSNSHICTWLLAKPPTLSPYRSESHPYDLI